MAIPRMEAEERVTNLELFFDLVFVFAITQVTALMADHPGWAGIGQGMLVLTALWFAWASYAWLTNTINPEEGSVRLAIFFTMAALLVCSMAVPRAFGADGVIFGVCYLIVRVMHLALYGIAARGDGTLVPVVRNLAPSMLGAAALILAAGFADGTAQWVLWATAIAVELAGPLIKGVAGWRLNPGHFAERHGLIIIIALGESVVAVGAGAAREELTAAIIVAGVLGIAVATALWWAYFDVVAPVAARLLAARQGAERARMARDAYTYLHLPMVAGIILFALGMKKTLVHVHEPLSIESAVALCGGMSLYLLALVAFRLRNLGTLNRQRLVTALVLAALIPVAHRLDALPALAVVAVVCCVLTVYEAIRFREARDRIRHPQEVAVP